VRVLLVVGIAVQTALLTISTYATTIVDFDREIEYTLTRWYPAGRRIQHPHLVRRSGLKGPERFDMAEALPGSPTREPNNVTYDNDPSRPTRDNGIHRGPSRLDEPQRERSYPGSGGDPDESITITLDGDGKSAGKRDTDAELRRDLAAERSRRQQLEAAQRQMQLVQNKTLIESEYANTWNRREELMRQAADKAASYEHVEAERLRGEAAVLAAQLVTLHDGKLQAETEIKRQQQQPIDEYQRRQQYLNQQTAANRRLIEEAGNKFWSSESYRNAAISASGYLVNRGYKSDGSDPRYEKEMRRMMNEGSRSRESGGRYSAPPSRESGLSTNGGYVRGEVVTLTPEQVAIAKATLTPDIIGKGRDPLVVYAQRLAELRREQGY
jgi:hypothetical protein